MKKNLLIIAAIASVTLVSCSSDEFGGEENYPIPVQDAPIAFGSYFKAMTRADVRGAEAAKLLGKKFVVSGYKGDETATVGSIVFDNYQVVWKENTANTTESNSDNWEYVGVTPIQHATDAGITAQKIKYWDYSQKQYDFIAWSTGSKEAVYTGTPDDDDQVLVTAIKPSTATTAAYTFTGTAEALSNCYIADLVTVKKDGKGNGDTYGVANLGYNNAVTFKFRQLGTKVRIALYETVPGYSVKDVKFYSAAAVDLVKSGDAKPESGNYTDEEAAEKNAEAKLFTTTENNIFTKGTYTVSFPTVDTPDDADNNQAHVSFNGDGDQSTTIGWDAVNYTIAEDGEKTEGNVFLGRTSNTASFAGNAANNYYVIYLPNSNGTNLNLRVDYTLESTDGSGEEINVRGATAQVPSIYTQWKPGFAYTYLFKISDKTNGHTGEYDPLHPDDTTINSDPAGLYPITFDAVVVNAEEGNNTQETITLVSTPSITTYQEGSNVVNNNEYTSGNKIYVTVSEGNSETTPDLEHSKLQKLEGKVALYTLSEEKTEAEVIDALSLQDDDAAANTIKGRNGLVLTEAAFELGSKIRYGVDGNVITAGNMRALNFTPEAGTTYAFVYTKSDPAATTETEIYQPVTKARGASVAGLYRYALKNAPAGDVQKDVIYFTSSSSDMVENIFLGQTVSNLYLDAQGTTIASGYAVSGTTYYYSYMDGQTKKYKAAHNVAYEEFEAATDLYTFDGTDYTQKTDAKPANGVAYYQKTTENINNVDVDVYTYCVIMPQQTNPTPGDRLKVIDQNAAKLLCTDSMKAVKGMTYFDKYTQNDAVRYAKVIKVQ